VTSSEHTELELFDGEGTPPDDLQYALPPEWFEREKHELARELLGRDLVRRTEDRLVAGRIVEVEAYGGTHDPASHADSGTPTERTAAMFGRPGEAYVYQIYGQYHCLNVVAPAEKKAAAILIRALEPLAGLEAMAAGRGLDEQYDGRAPRSIRTDLASGPGKLCQALRIDREFDGDALWDEPLWIAPGEPVLETRGADAVETTSRIGLNPDTVGEATDWPWRYVLSTSDYLSR